MIECIINRFQHKAGAAVQTGKIDHLAKNKSRIDRFKGYSYDYKGKPWCIGARYPLNVWMEQDYE